MGKLGKSPELERSIKRKAMSRITLVILAAVLIVGLLVFLSTQAREVPVQTIETDVIPAPDAR